MNTVICSAPWGHLSGPLESASQKEAIGGLEIGFGLHYREIWLIQIFVLTLNTVNTRVGLTTLNLL